MTFTSKPTVPATVEVQDKLEVNKATTKKDMEWRTPWHEREKERLQLLRTFYKEESKSSLLKTLTSDIVHADVSFKGIKKWMARKEEEKKIVMQGYIAQRHDILGNELAAAHFILFRGGAVKFFDEDRWIKADAQKRFELPNQYVEDKILQAIDCNGMDIYFEGLVNFRNLRNVEWLSFNECDNIDDWCMDRISNIFSHSLSYLDLRDCPKITERGLGALYKMRNLKILYVDDIYLSNEFEMTCIMLQQLNPDLQIKVC